MGRSGQRCHIWLVDLVTLFLRDTASVQVQTRRSASKQDTAYACAAFLALRPRPVACLLDNSLTLHACPLHRLKWIVRGSGEAKLTVDFQRAGTLEVAVEVDGDATLAAAM